MQHFLTALPGDLAQTLAIFGPLCLQIPERQDRLGTIQAEIFSTILFMSGISTVLQATFGVRYAIVIRLLLLMQQIRSHLYYC